MEENENINKNETQELIQEEIIEDESDFEWFVEEVEWQKKFPNKFAKLLHQRNEARKMAEEYQQKLEQYGDLENIQQILWEHQEMKNYKTKKQFTEKYPDAETLRKDIDVLVWQNPWLSLENAYKIIRFERISDEQNINKQNAPKTAIFGHTPRSIRKSRSFDNMDLNNQLQYLKTQFKNWTLKV